MAERREGEHGRAPAAAPRICTGTGTSGLSQMDRPGRRSGSWNGRNGLGAGRAVSAVAGPGLIAELRRPRAEVEAGDVLGAEAQARHR